VVATVRRVGGVAGDVAAVVDGPSAVALAERPGERRARVERDPVDRPRPGGVAAWGVSDGAPRVVPGAPRAVSGACVGGAVADEQRARRRLVPHDLHAVRYPTRG
jgi:hypothetical protein